ncbi:OLC1v1015813C1 [Oldenlandia corymbosa var. corymbosa]|uniref:OLC1v1015813C1 n=1 Tax=Oldenlandia corymbosa var. corymbosa TaxID=529605 RepID=A0AAV1E3Z8_OLDCO|nr:OLC1v1015813C1 [Oldenlandia corymbosa var. corymbosa]
MYARMRQEEVHRMMQRLARATKDSGMVDLSSAFFELTLSITMRMVAGKREHLSEDEKLEEAKKLREIIKASNLLNTNIPDYVPLLRWTGRRGKLLKVLEDLQSQREGFMQSLLEERRKILSEVGDLNQEETNIKCIIDVFLSLQQNEPEFYTDDMINGMVQMMIVGGSETTAILMEWVLSLLLNHPNVVKKAYQEIQNHIGGSNRLIDEFDLNHLPYLQAIIDETLRLYPSPAILSHHVASKDCTVGGYNIPRGTFLIVNLEAIQTDPKLWDEPTTFKPERFLNVEKKDFGFSYLPFGYGRRACPAEVLGMKVMGLAFGSLIQCFDWDRVSEKLLDMKLSEGGEFNMPRVTPLLAKCKIRPEMANHLF